MKRLVILPIAAAAMIGATAQGQDAPTNWPLIGTYTNAGITTGNFEGSSETVGSYVSEVTVYWLDDNGYTGADWARIDHKLTSKVDRFRDGSSICGWWTDKVNGAFALITDGGKIFDYGPRDGFEKSGTGVYFIASKGPSAISNVQPIYGTAQSVADAKFTVTEDSTNNTLRWVTDVKGCKGSKYVGKTNAAKKEFTLTTSVMVEIPEGQALKFQTSIDSETMSEIRVVKFKDNGKADITRESNYAFNRWFSCTRPSNGNAGTCKIVKDNVVRW